MISGVSGMTWIVFLSLSQASVYKRYEKKMRKIILEFIFFFDYVPVTSPLYKVEIKLIKLHKFLLFK